MSVEDANFWLNNLDKFLYVLFAFYVLAVSYYYSKTTVSSISPRLHAALNLTTALSVVYGNTALAKFMFVGFCAPLALIIVSLVL